MNHGEALKTGRCRRHESRCRKGCRAFRQTLRKPCFSLCRGGARGGGVGAPQCFEGTLQGFDAGCTGFNVSWLDTCNHRLLLLGFSEFDEGLPGLVPIATAGFLPGSSLVALKVRQAAPKPC